MGFFLSDVFAHAFFGTGDPTDLPIEVSRVDQNANKTGTCLAFALKGAGVW